MYPNGNNHPVRAPILSVSAVMKHIEQHLNSLHSLIIYLFCKDAPDNDWMHVSDSRYWSLYADVKTEQLLHIHLISTYAEPFPFCGNTLEKVALVVFVVLVVLV